MLVFTAKFNRHCLPLIIGGKMEVQSKVDSKGRITIPPELRKEIGDTVVLRETPEGIMIIPGKAVDFIEEFQKTITSEPPRTGKPENWPPSRMKAVWRTP